MTTIDAVLTSSIETPSGKTAEDENFPVGSWLLPAKLRPHIARFYAFARGADDVADNPDLAPGDKVARLDGLAAALRGETDDPAYAVAHRLRASLAETGVTARHGLDLLSAFRQDATRLRYADWDDLMDYCARSASPVGRYLLDLHGESADGYAASDPLCDALQVLNHLQDARDDHRALDRVYLPMDWMAANGVPVDALQAAEASPGLRTVIDLCLDGTEELLARAASLPARLASRRLAMESAVIWRLARRLSRRLRRGDPIAGRVALSKPDFLRCGAMGIAAGLVWRRPGPSAVGRPVASPGGHGRP